MCLLQYGWLPIHLLRWASPAGDIYGLPDDCSDCAFLDADFALLLGAIRESIQAKLWEDASKEYLGGGLRHGVDLQESRHPSGALAAFASAAAWPRQCLLRIEMDSYLCQRCRTAVETPFHRAWGCPRNDEVAELRDSDHLRHRVAAEVPELDA